MGPVRTSVAVLVLALSCLAAGCGSESRSSSQSPGAGEQPAEPQLVTVYELGRTADGYRLRAVEAPVPEREEGQSPYTSDAMRAVAAMLDHKPARRVAETLWRVCGAGREVDALELGDDRVTVRFSNPRDVVCELRPDDDELRGQQLAWTIIVNAKAELGGPPFPEIVVHPPAGMEWEPIRPDQSFLPRGRRY